MPAPHRILYVNHVGRMSGAERSLLDLVRRLDRGRFEPEAVIPGPGELADELARAGVRCHILPLRRLHKTLNPFRLIAALVNVCVVSRRLAGLIRREHIALVHANSNTAQLYAGGAARLAGVPCVWHTRDLVALGPVGRWLDHTSACTIAIADGVRRHVERYVRDREKLRTIHNGIELPEPAPSGVRSMVRAELGVPPGVPLCGMVGQLVPWKGHRTFIEMAARLHAVLPDAHFVIVGADLFDEHRSYRRQLEDRAGELGLADRLVFTGYRRGVSDVLAGLDVLVHPSTCEPLGRVILEAMAAGTPVVAVNAWGPAEIIRDGVDGLLTATNQPDELAAAVLRLLRDSELAGRLGQAGRRRVERDFRIGDTVSRIEAIYDDLLQTRGQHARSD